jgi:bifunctional non-homologous end joining protein LigD
LDSLSALLISNQTDMLRPFGFIEPCLPTNSRIVPAGPQWAYEIKHDGFRFICQRDGDRVRVFSRRLDRPRSADRRRYGRSRSCR